MEKNEINKIVTEIKDVIDAMRFYINQDGGDLEFVEFNPDNGEVVIKLLGQCVGCALIDVTYKDGLETILKNEVKGVCSVRVIE
ncbi:MAG: NifU family protein [Malacoplasma sp.]|mgnify:CR=1 FL=1|nr:NifU family protein [Malacoplasma sp.]